MRRLSLSALVIVSPLVAMCFREAPPCDQPGFDAVADQCVKDRVTPAECRARLDKHEAFCVAKVKAEK